MPKRTIKILSVEESYKLHYDRKAEEHELFLSEASALLAVDLQRRNIESTSILPLDTNFREIDDSGSDISDDILSESNIEEEFNDEDES